MNRRYASKTKVSSLQSRNEIERLLERYGADHFLYANTPTEAVIGFRIESLPIRITLPLPDQTDFEFTTRGGSSRPVARTPAQQQSAYQQAIRQSWRALALVLKAKLEAVDAGITTIEHQFLPNILLPDNTTIGDRLTAQLPQIVSGHPPPMLLPPNTTPPNT